VETSQYNKEKKLEEKELTHSLSRSSWKNSRYGPRLFCNNFYVICRIYSFVHIYE